MPFIMAVCRPPVHTRGDSRDRFDGLLHEAQQGSADARRELCRLVYDELHAAAHGIMPPAACNGHTLQPTVLLNEVMIRLLARPNLARIENRRCFFSVAINAMEKILIDHYRRTHSIKRGRGWRRLPIDAVLKQIEAKSQTSYHALHEAIEQLRIDSERQYQVVRLRFLGGLTVKETAELLEVSVGTVAGDWRLAKAKLYRDLSGGAG